MYLTKLDTEAHQCCDSIEELESNRLLSPHKPRIDDLRGKMHAQLLPLLRGAVSMLNLLVLVVIYTTVFVLLACGWVNGTNREVQVYMLCHPNKQVDFYPCKIA